MNKPIKRVTELQDLSRDHHQGLLLCWKIRTGIKRGIENNRIMQYVQWFWLNHLEEHFEIEETMVFPVLGEENEMVKQALSEHRRIKSLIEGGKGDLSVRLNSIEELIEKHIRFEERQLFNEIQQVASGEELKKIQLAHTSQEFKDNMSDPFWVSAK